jgi:murein DD-endopeptidase MepM/ murein hydrolase activator NlpD
MRRKLNINLVLIGCLLSLISCHTKQANPGGKASSTQTVIEEQATQTSVIFSQPTSTAVLAGESGSSHLNTSTTPVEPPVVIPSPAADPLKLAFPTPGTGLVSTWRPPLYPVPWAPTTHDHFYFARPIAADQVNWPEADYRYGGEFFENVIHTGVDIPVFEGTPVLAAGAGKVVWAGYGIYRGGHDETDPYGLAVAIRHDFGYQDQTLFTLYGHMSEIKVVVGQHVETGELLGLSGSTGKVTGPHLHFEVRLGQNDFFTTRNPELWIAPPQGWGVLAGRVMQSNSELLYGQYIIVSAPNGQNWFAKTYGAGTVNSDPYYQENMVIGDLPAGKYTIRIYYGGTSYTNEVTIEPGLVSYFEFRGFYGFGSTIPLGARVDNSPVTTVTPTKRP